MIPYFLTGTVNGLGEREAARMARDGAPAVARVQDRGRWTVYFLSTRPPQQGQAEFILAAAERAAIERSN